jgi:hypothetical protein
VSDPKREMYVGGSLVKQLLRLFKPLKAGQKQSQAATRGQAVHNKDVAGGIVVAGGLGYLANSDEGMALLEAADAGEIDAEIKETTKELILTIFLLIKKILTLLLLFKILLEKLEKQEQILLNLKVEHI